MPVNMLPAYRPDPVRMRELTHLIEREPDHHHLPPFVATAIKRVAKEFGTTAAAILGGDLRRVVSRARREVIRQLATDYRGFSTVQIGRWLRIHHTSVIHALKGRKTAGKLVAVCVSDPSRKNGRARFIWESEINEFGADESGIWAI